jgi:hypothetical protein
VGDQRFVKRVFKEASPPIIGVIQGAMVLRVVLVRPVTSCKTVNVVV